MKKTTKIKLFKIDKILFSIMIGFGLLIPTLIVFLKATLSSTNIDVEKLKNKISKQESINQSLVMKINELASLTNIQTIAKEYGLSYNNDNILVIKDN